MAKVAKCLDESRLEVRVTVTLVRGRGREWFLWASVVYGDYSVLEFHLVRGTRLDKPFEAMATFE